MSYISLSSLHRHGHGQHFGDGACRCRCSVCKLTLLYVFENIAFLLFILSIVSIRRVFEHTLGALAIIDLFNGDFLVPGLLWLRVSIVPSLFEACFSAARLPPLCTALCGVVCIIPHFASDCCQFPTFRVGFLVVIWA